MSKVSNLADRFTFGRWWTTAPILATQLKTSSLAELEYIVRCAVGFHLLTRSLGSDAADALGDELELALGHAVRSPAEFLRQVSTGKRIDWAWLQTKLKSSRDLTTTFAPPLKRAWTPLNQEEIGVGLDQFESAAGVVGGDLEKFGERLRDRWGLDGAPADAVRDVLLELATAIGALGAGHHVEVVMAPAVLDTYIDQAMFIPLPPELPIMIIMPERYFRLVRANAFAASRVLLATTHEALGHGTQFGMVSSGRGDCADAHLDREWMEGWAIQAESLLVGLGPDEAALSHLYRSKRLMPLIRQAAGADDWGQHRARIEAAWPNFFSDPATVVLRRATGTHARGMISVERFRASDPGRSWHDSTTPWLAAESRTRPFEPTEVNPNPR